LKNKMSIQTWWNPTTLMAIAAVLTTAAAIWSKIQQGKKEDVRTELLQDIAARSGNREAMTELIATRARLLQERAVSKNQLEELFARIPEKAEDYNKLREHTLNEAASQDSEFRLTCEPIIRYVISNFDKAIAAAKGRNYGIQVEEDNNISFTNCDGKPIRVTRVRGAKLGEAELRLNYRGCPVLPEPGWTNKNAVIYITILADQRESEEMLLIVENKEIAVFDGPRGERLRLAVPKDGIPSLEATAMIDAEMANALDKFLVRAVASRKKV
jgi:hypothetical protein